MLATAKRLRQLGVLGMNERNSRPNPALTTRAGSIRWSTTSWNTKRLALQRRDCRATSSTA
jgi:hypothetical protein